MLQKIGKIKALKNGLLIGLLMVTVSVFSQGVDCNGAVAIAVNGSCINSGFTISAGNSGVADPACLTLPTNDDAWYKFTATSTTTNIDATGASKNIALVIYDGTCASLVEQGCDDQGTTSASIALTTTVSTVYYVRLIRTQTGGGSTTGNICVWSPPTMSYTSSTCTQTNTSDIEKCGTGNKEIIGIEVVTTGPVSPIDITQFRLQTTGSSDPVNDASNIDIYYTGASSTFATTTLFGSATPVAVATNVNVSGTQTLIEGNNYFWVVYDENSTATISNFLDALCNQVTVDGSNYIPTTTAPAGSRIIVTCPISPGGVGLTNITAWFKADILTLGNVTSWTTTYPTGGSATTITGASTIYPQATDTPSGDVTNYNRTVDFTGNASGSNMILEKVAALDLLDNNSAGNQGTFVGAYCLPSTFTCAGCAYVGYREQTTAIGDGITFRTRMGNGLARMAIGTSQSINGSRDYTQDFGPDIVSYTGNKSGAGTMDSHRKSLAVPVGVASGSQGNQGLFIGGRKNAGSFTHHFDGFISEFVFYDRDLSTAEIIKVHTYLAVKFGTTLDNSGGGTQGDYISTDGTTIWDASDNSGYHNDVMGIGRDDSEGLLQKQSHTYDDTTRLYLSTLSATNLANSGSFASNISYVLTGHNNGKMCHTAAVSAEKPAGILYRLEREWKVTNTNFTNNYSVDFTINSCANPGSVTVTDLRLLVDADGDFTNATIYAAGGGLSFSYAGNVITVTGISTAMIASNSTQYITIASVNKNTPLPIDLISFEAAPEGNKVALTWTTQTEINNDFFTIEKSSEGENWEEVIRTPGAGNSSSILSYGEFDNNPFIGTSYYRLKQTDFDGSFSYSSIVPVNMGPIVFADLYPNPSAGIIHLVVDAQHHSTINMSIYNLQGQLVVQKDYVLQKGSNQIAETLPQMIAGHYLVRLTMKDKTAIKKKILVIKNNH